MSHAVNLVARLLDTACQLHQTGRTNDAFTYLCKLIGLRDLPAQVAVEAHLRLAEILLKRQKPMRARKHLKIALRHDPENGRAHQLMGEAQQSGRLPDPYAALEHQRRAVELLGDAESLCVAGRSAVAQGMWEEGLDYLRKAAESAADDPNVLRQVVDGMLLANQGDEARQLVRGAMFRHSHDRRFRGLWDHLQFQQLRQQQGEALARRQSVEADDGPVLLRFERPTDGQMPRRKAKVYRQDGPSTLAGPHPVAISRPQIAR